MSEKLRIANFRQMKAIVESCGYVEQPRVSGSHVKFKNAAGQIVIVPDHGDLVRGTIQSILRQIGLSRDEYHKRLTAL